MGPGVRRSIAGLVIQCLVIGCLPNPALADPQLVPPGQHVDGPGEFLPPDDAIKAAQLLRDAKRTAEELDAAKAALKIKDAESEALNRANWQAGVEIQLYEKIVTLKDEMLADRKALLDEQRAVLAEARKTIEQDQKTVERLDQRIERLEKRQFLLTLLGPLGLLIGFVAGIHP